MDLVSNRDYNHGAIIRIYGRVRTLLSCLNSMTSHDFFHDLFKFSKTLGLAVSFKNSNPKLVLERFLALNSPTDKLWSSPKCVPFTLLN